MGLGRSLTLEDRVFKRDETAEDEAKEEEDEVMAETEE